MNGAPRNLWATARNLGPRFGFAYSIDPKTVLRSGFAVTFFPTTQRAYILSSGQGYSVTNTVTTTNNGTVTMQTSGTFTYSPVAGFSGTDSFFYAVTSGTTGIATAQVTITVTGVIWFINAGASGTHVGTFANPFSCLTGGAGCFSNVNDGAAGHPKDSDTVFMYSGAYTGGLTPRTGQKLIGQGAMGQAYRAVDTARDGADAPIDVKPLTAAFRVGR